MGNIGPEKLMLLLVVALVVLGPSKLPEAARTMGKVLAEFQRISGGFRAEMRDALFDPVASTRDTITTTRDTISSARDAITSTFRDGGSEVGSPGRSDMPSPGGRATRPPTPLPDDPTLN